MGGTILCVDDDPRMLMLYRTALEDRGYRVLIESNGHDGLLDCERCPVDCILLDYQMPEMDGAEFVQRLNCQRFRTPVILVSGHSDIPRELLDNATAFIEKPVSMQKLLKRIEEVVGSTDRSSTCQPQNTVIHATQRG